MQTEQQVQSPKAIIVQWSRILFIVVAWLYIACIIAQVFLAGLSIFVSASWWQWHEAAGHWFNPLPIVLLILAFSGRFSRTIILLSALVFVQYELQVIFIEVSRGLQVPLVAVFHPVNALIMFWVTLVVARQAQNWNNARKS